MTNTAENLLFDLSLTDEQRMNRETMQRFAAAEIRDQAKVADEAGITPDDFYAKTAELGLAHKVPLADAVILAAARAHEAVIWTQDADFEGLAGVRYQPVP